MIITQADETKTGRYYSMSEITSQRQEQYWINPYANGQSFNLLEDMFEDALKDPKNGLFKTEFDKLELVVLSSDEERIDLHLALNPGEKAVLYSSLNDHQPFWCEVMLLLLFDNTGALVNKFFFNDEYYYFYHHLKEIEEEYEENRLKYSEEKLEEETSTKIVKLAKRLDSLINPSDPHVHVIVQNN